MLIKTHQSVNKHNYTNKVEDLMKKYSKNYRKNETENQRNSNNQRALDRQSGADSFNFKGYGSWYDDTYVSSSTNMRALAVRSHK